MKCAGSAPEVRGKSASGARKMRRTSTDTVRQVCEVGVRRMVAQSVGNIQTACAVSAREFCANGPWQVLGESVRGEWAEKCAETAWIECAPEACANSARHVREVRTKGRRQKIRKVGARWAQSGPKVCGGSVRKVYTGSARQRCVQSPRENAFSARRSERKRKLRSLYVSRMCSPIVFAECVSKVRAPSVLAERARKVCAPGVYAKCARLLRTHTVRAESVQCACAKYVRKASPQRVRANYA